MVAHEAGHVLPEGQSASEGASEWLASAGSYRATDLAIRPTSASGSGSWQRLVLTASSAASISLADIPRRRMVPARDIKAVLRGPRGSARLLVMLRRCPAMLWRGPVARPVGAPVACPDYGRRPRHKASHWYARTVARPRSPIGAQVKARSNAGLGGGGYTRMGEVEMPPAAGDHLRCVGERAVATLRSARGSSPPCLGSTFRTMIPLALPVAIARVFGRASAASLAPGAMTIRAWPPNGEDSQTSLGVVQGASRGEAALLMIRVRAYDSPFRWQRLWRLQKWCRGAELNCRHHDFQSCALPPELPRPGRILV